MTDVGSDHNKVSTGQGLPSPPSPTAAVFAVVLLAGLGAAGAAFGLGDILGLAVGAAIAVAGAVVASVAAGKSAPPDLKAIALLEAVSAESAAPSPPSRFRGEPWASLYLQAVGNAEAQRTATLAVQEVERLRQELEQRSGADADTAFVPSPSHGSDDLVGGEPESEAAAWTPEPSGTTARAATLRALTEALDPIREELSAIERDLEPIVSSLRADDPSVSPSKNSTPAAMVDALVQTAADGIEDLAAGLMRASELAGVAERVTNRATLLALNAALEATRSGSEAFASIAEETRRLAEYAREATDTISRLSNEIEDKVGETISSIQTSSEDAKAAVASIGSGTGHAEPAVAPETVAALRALFLRVRSLRQRSAIREEAPVAAFEPPPSDVLPVSSVSPMNEPQDSVVDREEEEARPSVGVTFIGPEGREENGESMGGGDPPPEEHRAYGDVVIGEVESQPSSFESPQLPVESEPPVESAMTSEPSAAAEPAAPVVPKIPDWLEGIEPRHRG